MQCEFKPFKKSLSGGVKWENKTKEQREHSRKEAERKATCNAMLPTNRMFAKTERFTELCKLACTKPTKRQASKFRSKRGLAWKALKEIS